MSTRSTRKFGRKSATALATATALVALQRQSNAQTPTNWVGTTGSYVDTANWSNGVPTNAGNSLATINNSGTAQISGTDAAEGAFLYLGYTTGDVGHLEISGGTLTVGEMRVGGTEVLSDLTTPNPGGTGSVVQTGGTVNVNFTTGSEPPVQSLYIADAGQTSGNTAVGSWNISAGTLNSGIAINDSIVIGTGPGAQGTFTQSGGAVNCTGFVTVARRGATATYTMSGGTLSPTADLYIGDGEDNATISGTNGTFTQTNGNVTSTLTTNVGRNRGTGSYTITGGSLTANTNLNVGVGGTGTFVQGDVGTQPNVPVVSKLSMTVGLTGTTVGGTGSYTLNSGTLTVGTGTGDVLAIGNGVGSLGTFVQKAGTSVSSTGLVQLGRNNSTAANSYDMQGGSLSMGGDFWVGGGNSQPAGTGTFTQAAGTTITAAGNLNIGGGTAAGTSATGTYNMNGGTLTMTRTSAADVIAIGNGIGATGTLTQTAGTLTNKANTGSVTDIGRNGGVGIYNLSGTGVLDTTRLRLNAATGNRANLSGGSSTIGQLNCGAGIVTISGGTHTVTGTTTTDTGTLYLHGGNFTLGTSISLNSGSIIRSDVPYTIATSMSLGNITFQVDSSTMTLTGPISDPTNGRSITKTGAGTLNFGSTVSYAATPGTSNINANAGTFNVNSDFNSTSVALNVNAAMNINTAAQHVGSATVNTGGVATIAHTNLPAAQTKVLVTNAVAVNGTGKLDITDNKIITNTAVGTWNGTAYTGVTGMIASGYSPNQDFSGNGIVTTESSASGGNTLTNIGIASNADLGLTTFGGQSVSAGNTLVMYTYNGDANLDGVVNGDDYFQIDSAFPQGLHGWFNGDFNYDGVVNGDDYFVIDSTFPQQGAAIPTSGGVASATPLAGVSAVPEPASLALLAIGAGATLARRRRR